ASEVPDVVRHAQLVEQDDHAVAALALPLDEAIVPVPECAAEPNALLQRDVGPRHPGRELEDRAVVAALAVVLDLQRHLQARALAEPAQRHIQDGRRRDRARDGQLAARIQQRDREVVIQDRIGAYAQAAYEGHAIPPPRGSSAISSSLPVRPTRSTTNSNGYARATPTSARRLPAARWSGGLLLSSQRTKNASCGLAPAKAPRCQSASSRLVRARVSLLRVYTSFGSNTTHWVERSIAFSIIISRRRTLTKRQSASLLTVRAPRMRRPRAGRGRMTLMPSGFRTPWTASSTSTVTSSAQTSGALAGALCTPTVRSVWAYCPATWPLGGIARVSSVPERIGSTTRSQG